MTKHEEAAVVAQHERLIRSLALSFVRLGAFTTMEDLLQEGRIALLLAARNWKSDRGAAIWTYARRFVIGAMFAAVDQQRALPIADGQTGEDQADKSLSSDERLVLFELLDRLSTRERHIVVGHLCLGKTIEELVAELGVSVGTVWNVESTALAKMADAAGAAPIVPVTREAA